MISAKTADVAQRAKQLYEQKLRTDLEATHMNEFVAIEPDSQSYYLDHTFMEAGLAAKKAHPNRKSFVIRIGHDAAFHIGAALP